MKFFFFETKTLLTCFEGYLATARNMGKKKAKEPETPAKDEVSNFAEKSTENLPIDFLELNWLFEVVGNLRVLWNLFIHAKITQSTIEIVLSIIFLIYFRVVERLSKMVLVRNSQVGLINVHVIWHTCKARNFTRDFFWEGLS